MESQEACDHTSQFCSHAHLHGPHWVGESLEPLESHTAELRNFVSQVVAINDPFVAEDYIA